MAPPPEIQAIVVQGKGSAAITTVPPPRLRDGYLLVRTTAVGLNPADWKHLDFVGGFEGARMGSDFAGIVEAVGPAVTVPHAVGDRVCGLSLGSNKLEHEDGTFADYIAVKGDLAIKIPDNVSDEEAATLGIGITTVGQGLYQSLELPLPTSPSSSPIPLLIYGGSTGTGMLGIQFARLSGCRVATTCSPRNFGLVKALGADAAFDYASPTCVADIRAWAGEPGIALAWDCIATPEATRLTVAAMADGGGRYRSLLHVDDKLVKEVNPKVESGLTFAYTAVGEDFQKGWRAPAVPADFEFGKMFWELSRQLLAEGKIKSAKPDVNRGGKGLAGVLVGMQELRENKVSGTKLAYTL